MQINNWRCANVRVHSRENLKEAHLGLCQVLAPYGHRVTEINGMSYTACVHYNTGGQNLLHQSSAPGHLRSLRQGTNSLGTWVQAAQVVPSPSLPACTLCMHGAFAGGCLGRVRHRPWRRYASLRACGLVTVAWTENGVSISL